MPPTRTVTDAADAFLTRATATTTRRSYGQTMNALTKAHGNRPLATLGAGAIAELTADSWGTLAPVTWNRHVATLRSFTMFCRRNGWLQGGDPALPVAALAPLLYIPSIGRRH